MWLSAIRCTKCFVHTPILWESTVVTGRIHTSRLQRRFIRSTRTKDCFLTKKALTGNRRRPKQKSSASLERLACWDRFIVWAAADGATGRHHTSSTQRGAPRPKRNRQNARAREFTTASEQACGDLLTVKA